MTWSDWNKMEKDRKKLHGNKVLFAFSWRTQRITKE